MLTDDGHLWVNWFDGSAWHWADQKKPDKAKIESAVGAITVDGNRPYVFVLSTEGNLWVNWYDGWAWHWSDEGVPKE